jgi:membrane fusion protein (multidrug efflux system)
MRSALASPAVLSGVLLATLLAACPPAEDGAAAPTTTLSVDLAPVRVAAVQREALRRTLELGGVASAWRSARLVPTGQGVVTQLPVTLGQRVKKGDLLAALDTSSTRLQAEQARKATRLAELQLADARRQAARAEDLAAQGALPEADLERARAGLELAQAQLDQASASVAVVEDALGKARLTAPFAGTVTLVALEVGEFFAPMAGLGGPPALVAIDALDPVKLDVFVPDVDLGRMAEGMKVEVTSDALPGQTFEGEVAMIGAAAEPGTRTFRVRIRVPNEDRKLRPGFFLTGRLVLEEKADVVTVPVLAVTDADSDPWVMVVQADVAQRVKVQLGLHGDAGWEVTGVEPGAQVITEGHFGLPDGSRVRVIN